MYLPQLHAAGCNTQVFHCVGGVLCRQAAGSRELLATSDATKTIFNNGWAPECGWWALGASNISIVPGAGVGQSNGLCTTFPAAGVSFLPCACSRMQPSSFKTVSSQTVPNSLSCLSDRNVEVDYCSDQRTPFECAVSLHCFSALLD